jgi:hypothetical protein
MEKRVTRMGKNEIIPAIIFDRVEDLDVHYVKGYRV